jgi:peptidoglycan/xylan/chitin deacetylase (PgdA/CDA1 family)
MRLFLFICICLFSVALSAAQDSFDQIDQSGALGNATILIYHKFGEDQYPTTNIAVDKFASQLKYLHDNDFTVLSLKSLVELLENGHGIPDKTVAITIDDGYTSTFTAAWPLLKQYGYPFTVFLYVEAVERQYRNFLTWEQIREMRLAGVDFQDHGYSHSRFGDAPQGVNDAEYENWVTADLRKGNKILAEHLGYKPHFLALPYGEYNTIIQQVARQLNYRAVFSQDPGSVSRYTDIYAIPREPILGIDWSTMEHFTTILARKDLPVTDMFPPAKPLINLKPENFCATIVAPELYKKESFGIYVSELGWQSGKFIGNRLCIKNDATLERRSNRVAISAQEKKSGAAAMRYWLLIRK